MRISDWSSDVCASDLRGVARIVGDRRAAIVEAFHQLRDGGGVAVAIDAADPARRVEPDRFDILHGSEACRLEHAAHCRLAAGAAAAGEFDGEQGARGERSEEHTSELQSLMRNSYAVFRVKKKSIHKK